MMIVTIVMIAPFEFYIKGFPNTPITTGYNNKDRRIILINYETFKFAFKFSLSDKKKKKP